MSVILSGVQGGGSGNHGSIALVLLGPGQVHVVVSGGIKVLEFLSPVGQVVQSGSNFLRDKANLNNGSVGNEGIVDWESSGGVGRSISHNRGVRGDIGLNNCSSSIQFSISKVGSNVNKEWCLNQNLSCVVNKLFNS